MPSGIYKFENKMNGMVYIGQSVNLEARYNKHIKNIKDLSKTEDLYKALREFGIENFNYTILESFEELDIDKLNELEKYYINLYNSLKPNGYNMVPGGSNGSGLAKGKKVQQFDLKGNFICEYNSCHQASEITKIDYSSIAACARGDIIHTGMFQWKYTEDNKEIRELDLVNIICADRKIYQYDLISGVLLKEYNNLNEAAFQSQISKSSICKVCKGNGKTAGGFIWSYYKLDNARQNENHQLIKEKPVEQYDKNGNFIAEYQSITEASNITHIHKGNIGAVCNGKRKTAGNYIWKFKF